MHLKNGFGNCSLFAYHLMDEKIKTWPLRFPAKVTQYGEGIVRLANHVAV